MFYKTKKMLNANSVVFLFYITSSKAKRILTKLLLYIMTFSPSYTIFLSLLAVEIIVQYVSMQGLVGTCVDMILFILLESIIR